MTFTKRSSLYDDDGFGSGSRGLLSYTEGDSWDMDSDYIVISAQNDSIGSEYGQTCEDGCGCAVGFGNTLQLPNGTLVTVYMHDQSSSTANASGAHAAITIGVVRWELIATNEGR
jgi:hypothetical protein